MTDEVCAKCGAVHDPTRCNAHSKMQLGGQCQRAPMADQKVCATHGGKAPQALAAAATRNTDNKIRQKLGQLVSTPVANPLAALQELAGEAQAWKELCAQHVAELERMRYGTEGGEAIRGEIILFERAIDRLGRLLVDIAKLNIDERLAKVSEMQLDLVARALTAWMAESGMGPEEQLEARRGVARHLRLISG
jgi:hypothetical protein